MIRILFIGDIVGQDGLNLCTDFLPLLKNDTKFDFCVANGENSDAGKGISSNQAKKLINAGVNVITSGNHIWQKDGIRVLNNPSLKTIRPANYPEGTPGNGYLIEQIQDKKVAVLNLQGRSFLPPVDCPFKTSLKIIERIKHETKLILIDFHAEASAEKQALGWYLDGKVSMILGTHTHVQTADERILHKGTAYITDVGMTGPFDSVIGMDIRTAIDRFETQIPRYFKLASRNLQLNGVVVDINETTGKALKIQRLKISRENYGSIKDIKW